MPSSTSSSSIQVEATLQRGRASGRDHGVWSRGHWILLLLVLLMLLVLSTELIAKFGLEHISKIHRRMMGEARAASQIHHAGPGKPRTVLLVGNSLLLQGIDLPRIQREEAANFRISRYVVENTAWYDWYYGIKNLLRSGTRPDYLVLCMADHHFVSSAMRGEFSARYLFGFRDIWPLSRDLHLDLTSTSNLYAAQLSTFYATRSEIRQVLMGKSVPAVPQLMHDLTVTSAPPMSDERMLAIATPRFVLLREACAEYQVRCVILIVPILGEPTTSIQQAADAAKIPFYRPIPNQGISRELYSDGYHLSEEGSEIYTSAVESELTTWK